MSEAAARHAELVAALRRTEAAPDEVLDAFARVPRHTFLPGVPLAAAYGDDAIITREADGMPTSSSSQPSLMARMLARLDVAPGLRVLEVGAGTGYNAALLATLGAAVTTVELQDDVARAARAALEAAGIPLSEGPPAAGAVRVVTGDGSLPPPGPYERVIVTASLWSLPAGLVAALADGGTLVAPLRVNGVEAVLALRRDGERLHGRGALPCGFMPLRGADERPWRWELGPGGLATSDADLGVEGRGALDRLLASPPREVPDPLGLRKGEEGLHALLWLALQGDPLLTLTLPGEPHRRSWSVALDVLPASLLLIDLGPPRIGRLYGAEGALRTCAAAMASWRAAGAPTADQLELTVERGSERAVWPLPCPTGDGGSALVRGAHRWTFAYAPG